MIECPHRFESPVNGYLYCRKSYDGAAYCIFDKGSMASAHECPNGLERIYPERNSRQFGGSQICLDRFEEE